MGSPTLSYANWCTQLGDAGAKHRSSIAFGPDTYDAWARGTTPDSYAKSKAKRKAKATAKPASSEHETVTIIWYVTPNENKKAGGFVPVHTVDGKQRASAWYGRAFDKATAERMAEHDAKEEAERYVGDWNVVVRKRK